MSFKFNYNAKATKKAEKESSGFGDYNFVNFKDLPENEPFWFRLLPFKDSTYEALNGGLAFLAVKKWVFKSTEDNGKGGYKYKTTISERSANRDGKDFGDRLIAWCNEQYERVEYPDGEFILDNNGNKLLSYAVEETENPAIEIFRRIFLYAGVKKNPVTKEALGDNTRIRSPYNAGQVEYWVAGQQVNADTNGKKKTFENEKCSGVVQLGSPAFYSIPAQVKAAIFGGQYGGAEVAGLIGNPQVGSAIMDNPGFDICVTRRKKAQKGSNFEVAFRLQKTYLADVKVYSDEKRLDGIGTIVSGIHTEECWKSFLQLVGELETEEDNGAAAVAAMKKKKKEKEKEKAAPTSTIGQKPGRRRINLFPDDENAVPVPSRNSGGKKAKAAAEEE